MKRSGKGVVPGEGTLLLILIAMTVLCSVMIVIPKFVNNGYQADEIVYDRDLISFNTGWHIEYPAGSMDDVTLPVKVDAPAGSTVSISKKLPADMTDGMYVRAYSDNSFVSASVDENVFYVSSADGSPSEKWNFIRLDPRDAGATLTLTFTSPGLYYSGVVPDIILCTLPEMLLYTSSGASVCMYLGMCIIALGAIVLMLSAINSVEDPSLRRYCYLALYIIVMGLILLTRARMPRNTQREYLTDQLVFNAAVRIWPAFYFIFAYTAPDGRYRRISFAMVVLCAVDLAVCMGLYELGICDTGRMMWAALLPAALCCLFGMLREISVPAGAAGRRRLLPVIGHGALLACMALESVFRLSLYSSGRTDAIAAGFLICALSLSASAAVSSYDSAMAQLRLQKELDEKRLKLMMNQMQPHFIYNTLNTIRGMTLSEPEKANDMIYSFSNYLRHNIAALGEEDVIPFSEELEHIRAYTDIEQERFPGKIDAVYEIGCVSFLVPPLSVEVFVENAIKHGIRKRSGPGKLRIATSMEDTHYHIEIEDDGVGFDTSILEKGESEDMGIGIRNAVYRLKMLTEAHVEIKSSLGIGTKVSIIIPKVLDEEELG